MKGKKRLKKQFKRIVPSIFLALIILIALGGIFVSAQNKFNEGTYIQNVDCSKLKVTDAKSLIETKMEEQEIKFEFLGDNKYIILGKDIDLHLNQTQELTSILKNQKKHFKSSNLEKYFLSEAVKFDEESLKDYLQNFFNQAQSNMQNPKNAYIDWNYEQMQFVIVPEELGEKIDFEEAFNLSMDLIRVGKYDIDFSSVKKQNAEITSNDLKEQVEILNENYEIKTNPNISNFKYLQSYLGIDITSQTVCMYKNNELLVEAPCVTGNVSAGNDTPVGIYFLYGKSRNATLKGNNNDGTKYSSFVNYWMPFNGGIGLHDASWRSDFGGTIYENNGSHGCINLPFDAASLIFENINTSIPIVVYAS